jgi:hypothetical protein
MAYSLQSRQAALHYSVPSLCQSGCETASSLLVCLPSDPFGKGAQMLSPLPAQLWLTPLAIALPTATTTNATTPTKAPYSMVA